MSMETMTCSKTWRHTCTKGPHSCGAEIWGGSATAGLCMQQHRLGRVAGTAWQESCGEHSCMPLHTAGSTQAGRCTLHTPCHPSDTFLRRRTRAGTCRSECCRNKPGAIELTDQHWSASSAQLAVLVVSTITGNASMLWGVSQVPREPDSHQMRK